MKRGLMPYGNSDGPDQPVQVHDDQGFLHLHLSMYSRISRDSVSRQARS